MVRLRPFPTTDEFVSVLARLYTGPDEETMREARQLVKRVAHPGVEYRCGECRSTSLDSLAWVDVNTGVMKAVGPMDAYVCRECGEETLGEYVGGRLGTGTLRIGEYGR